MVAKRTFGFDDYTELCGYFGSANRREVHWSAATVSFPLTIASTRDSVPCITLTWTRIPIGPRCGSRRNSEQAFSVIHLRVRSYQGNCALLRLHAGDQALRQKWSDLFGGEIGNGKNLFANELLLAIEARKLCARFTNTNVDNSSCRVEVERLSTRRSLMGYFQPLQDSGWVQYHCFF